MNFTIFYTSVGTLAIEAVVWLLNSNYCYLLSGWGVAETNMISSLESIDSASSIAWSQHKPNGALQGRDFSGNAIAFGRGGAVCQMYLPLNDRTFGSK